MTNKKRSNSNELNDASPTKRLTMAEEDALERSQSTKGRRRSSRQLNRIPTGGMRRLHELFWKDDSLYDSDVENDDEDSCCSSDADDTSNNAVVLNFGKRSRWKRIHDSPHIYVMDDFLNESEIQYCQERILKTKFQTSVVDKFDDSLEVDQEQRTSTFVHFGKMQHSKIAAMETRVADLLGFTVQQLEPLQIVRYKAGQFFGTHHDMGVLYEDGSVELPTKSSCTPPRRLVTVFCYLNTVANGGCTYFPTLNLRVQPKRARAVLFCNIDKFGMPDPRTVHAGEPVVWTEPDSIETDDSTAAENNSTETDSSENEARKDSEKKRKDAKKKPSKQRDDDECKSLLNPNVKYGINIWACED